MSVDETPKDDVLVDAAQDEAVAEDAVTEVAEDSVTEVEEVAEEQVAELAEDAANEVAEPTPEPEPVPEPEPEPKPAPKPAPEPERRERKPRPAQRPAAAKPAAKPSGIQSLGMGAWIGIACAALVLGILVGKFLLGGGAAGSGALGGKLAVSEAELDTPIATYTYGGATSQITAREVILQNSSLEASVDADGNYSLPSADTVLSVARNSIIKKEAENRGITVSDEELAAYAEETLGSSDYASIATSYSMEEEAVKELLTNSCLMSKLRDEVIEADTSATMPDAPTAPESTTETQTQINPDTGEEEQVEVAVDNSAQPSAEYAAYIIGLAGDEWNAETGTWASPDGPYATALSGYEVTADSATYEAAQAAYYVAYQQYSESQSAVSTQWSDFVNGLLSNASIQISTLIA